MGIHRFGALSQPHAIILIKQLINYKTIAKIENPVPGGHRMVHLLLAEEYAARPAAI